MRWLPLAVALAGCSANQEKTARTLGYGLMIEGGALAGASYVAQSPHDGVADALVVGYPLWAVGAALVVFFHRH